MMYFEPMSGLAVVVQNTPPDTTDLITYPPSVISDSTAPGAPARPVRPTRCT